MQRLTQRLGPDRRAHAGLQPQQVAFIDLADHIHGADIAHLDGRIAAHLLAHPAGDLQDGAVDGRAQFGAGQCRLGLAFGDIEIGFGLGPDHAQPRLLGAKGRGGIGGGVG